MIAFQCMTEAEEAYERCVAFLECEAERIAGMHYGVPTKRALSFITVENTLRLAANSIRTKFLIRGKA